jgi:glycosyltransferase involved in cell wall biosynthesis
MFGQYDVIIKCITGKFALPVSYLAARVRRKPFILWTNLWYHPDTVFHRITFPVTKWIYRHADAVVTFGIHIQKYLEGLGADANRMFVSTQTVDSAIFGRAIPAEDSRLLRASLGLEDEHVILYVGRYDPIKGLEYLVQAIALVPSELKVHLILVGDGERKGPIKELVKELNISSRVSFVGYVANVDLYKYYAMASVFVLPSITLRNAKEVWGLVINEAMNQSCPVIATDAVGAAVGGLVKDGITGFVVPERDAQAIADAIIKILSNPDLRESMRKAALEEIQQWTFDRQVEGFMKAIEFVTKEKAHA